jgi:hypothetical protein
LKRTAATEGGDPVAEADTIERKTERDVAEPALQTGTRVEVRRRFDGSWTRGFEIAGTTAEGYLVKRLSDGSVLPVAFDPEEVRRDRRRRQGFWWQ